MFLAPIAAALALTGAPQASTDGPSFDCLQAFAAVENAICTDPRLANLDLRMANRYAVVRRGLPPAAREALLKDQRWFLGARDEWFENRERSGFKDFPDLFDRMTHRIEFLASVRNAGSELPGLWRNTAGYVDIEPVGQGMVRVQLSTAHPVNARWICNVEGTARIVNNALTLTPPDNDGWRIRVTKRQGFISVKEIGPEGTIRPWCGSNGHLDGGYFRTPRD